MDEVREVRDTVDDIEFAMANTDIWTEPRLLEAFKAIEGLDASDRRLLLVYAHFNCRPNKTAKYFKVDVRTVNTRLEIIFNKIRQNDLH